MALALYCLAGDDIATGECIRVYNTDIEMCTSGWFGRVFGTSPCDNKETVGLRVGFVPDPDSEPHLLNVFYVPAPHAVLREIVHILRFPLLYKVMRDTMPPSLTLHPTVWREYVVFLLGAR